MSEIEVIEFTDPGCSWAWGTEPKLRLIRWRYGDKLRWRRVLGGLIGDMKNYREDFDPIRAVERRIPYWREVYEHTRMSYPARLRWMYSSTEPACRAVKAAEFQSDDVGGKVLRRLREQTFVFGEPADTEERIIDAVRGTPGLDIDRFSVDLESDGAEKIFREDWDETRRPNAYVQTLEGDRPGIGRAKHTEGHTRYVFPTVIFRHTDREETVPGWCPLEDYENAMEYVMPGATDEQRPDPSPEQYFATWPTATEHELAVVCGDGATAPSEVVAYDWGEGTFFLRSDEARSRGL